MIAITKALRRFWFALRALVLRRRADAELDEELSFHLEREASLYAHSGMSADDARRQAARQFGGVLRYREECRDVRGTNWIDDLRTDVRLALRLVRFQPAFSANVILIAALGIAACTTTFSLVSGILLSPLPFSAADRIASLQLQSPEGRGSAAIPLDAYERLAAGTPVLDAIAAFRPGNSATNWGGEPDRVRTELVTPSYARVFGIAPIMGRWFSESEATEHAPVALLGYTLWTQRFHRDSSVLGKRVTLDDVPHTIIGVMPPRFRAQLTNEPDLWLPIVARAARTECGGCWPPVNAVVRIADTVTRAQAEAWLGTVIHARMLSAVGRDSVSGTPVLQPIAELVYGEVRRPLLVLLAAVLLVLVLVAANLATMFLARSSSRERELGMRRALGASRGRQLRQLVTEAATLTAIGGALGVIASYWAMQAIRGLGTGLLPRMDAVALDWRVLTFAAAGTIVTGIVGGLAPALSSRRAHPSVGHDASATRVSGQRTSSSLVVAQIALSVVLLVGAGLLMKSFLRVSPSDPGFALENRAVLNVSLRPPSFTDTSAVAARGFIQGVSERMRRVAGVIDVAATSWAPFTGMVSLVQIELPGRTELGRPPATMQNYVTPNYFDVMRLAVVRGRAFASHDDEGAEHVVIVNQTAAARWWPGQNPIGKQFTAVQLQNRFTVSVVGVAHDGRLFGTDTKVRPEIYVPVTQAHPRYVTFIVHTSVDPSTVQHELQRAIWSVAPRLPVATTTDLASLASESVRRERFFSVAMSLFALVAVGLTGLGIYGLLAFSVAQRRRELGIRLALGAPARSVGGLVLRRAVSMGLVGVIVGLLLARAVSHYMESVLLEVRPTDATVFAGTAVAVMLVAIAAACAPVVQAVRVDPIKSLRV